MNEFKKVRESLQMSQQAIAEHFGMPRRTWQDWERDERTPPEWVKILIFKELKEIAEKQKTARDSWGGVSKYKDCALAFARDSRTWPKDSYDSLGYVTEGRAGVECYISTEEAERLAGLYEDYRHSVLDDGQYSLAYDRMIEAVEK